VPDRSQPAISIRRGDQLVLAIFRDGFIEWATEGDRAGATLCGHIDAAAVDEVIGELRSSPLLGGAWTGELYTGPDSTYTSVLVRDGDTVLVDVGSWHELFEADPRLVATAGGVQPLGGRSREEVFAQQPAPYRKFRERWDYVLSRLRSLIPIAGVRNDEICTGSG
jgi:hypothetical protein